MSNTLFIDDCTKKEIKLNPTINMCTYNDDKNLERERERERERKKVWNEEGRLWKKKQIKPKLGRLE